MKLVLREKIILLIGLFTFVSCSQEQVGFDRRGNNSSGNLGEEIAAQFIDDPVMGLKYLQANGKEYAVGSAGLLRCKKGELVYFYIGKVMLGSAFCENKILVQKLKPSLTAGINSWKDAASYIQTLAIPGPNGELDLSHLDDDDIPEDMTELSNVNGYVTPVNAADRAIKYAQDNFSNQELVAAAKKSLEGAANGKFFVFEEKMDFEKSDARCRELYDAYEDDSGKSYVAVKIRKDVGDGIKLLTEEGTWSDDEPDMTATLINEGEWHLGSIFSPNGAQEQVLTSKVEHHVILDGELPGDPMCFVKAGEHDVIYDFEKKEYYQSTNDVWNEENEDEGVTNSCRGLHQFYGGDLTLEQFKQDRGFSESYVRYEYNFSKKADGTLNVGGERLIYTKEALFKDPENSNRKISIRNLNCVEKLVLVDEVSF